jgi:hypothetical protein
MTQQSWSEWLGVDAASRARRQEEKTKAQEEAHAKAVAELKTLLLETEEGRLCAKQLAESEC